MWELFAETMEWGDRLRGPLHFRLIVQPLVACVLGVRAGLRDAREGKPPYFWALVTGAAPRLDVLREGWKDVGTVWLVGVALDVIFQLITRRAVRPLESVVVAIVLVVLPYLVLRGPVTHIARKQK